MKQYIKPVTTKVELSEDIAASICGKEGLITASKADALTFKNHYKHFGFLDGGFHFFEQGYCSQKSKVISYDGTQDIELVPASFDSNSKKSGWQDGCTSFIGDVYINGVLQK